MKKCILLLLILLSSACSLKKYTVTFVDDGIEIGKIEVKSGDNLLDMAKPTKDGYIFVSWLKDNIEYDESMPIKEDITLSATWTQEPVLVKYHKVTFNFGTYKKTQTVRDGEKATKPSFNPTLEKHEFVGWYLGDNLYNFDNPVISDITIDAKFKKNRIVIKYDLSGGTGSTTQIEITKGTIPSRPKNPTKFGYDFVGWLLDGKPYNFDFPLNSDTTIKANYNATVYYKVSFDTDGGNIISSEMIASGKMLSDLPIPIKDGYTFRYWQYGNNEFDINTKIESDITLVAIYQENTNNELD